LAEAGDTERVAGFGVSLAKKRQVAAGACREIGLLFAGGGEVAPEPSWFDRTILDQESAR